MKKSVFACLFFFLMVSCQLLGDDMFDGKSICLNKSSYHISTGENVTGIPGANIEGYDYNGSGDGILTVTYKAGDPLFEKFVENFGEQENGYELISYWIQRLDQKSRLAYKSHPKIIDAYLFQGSYENAIKESLPNGLNKIYQEYYRTSWELFSQEKLDKDNYLDHWFGTCVKGAPLNGKDSPTKCEFFDFYDNKYLLSVSVPENYVQHKKEILRLIRRDLNERVFCKEKQ